MKSTPQIGTVHRWLKLQNENASGHISHWPPAVMDRYHAQLGLLVDFVTDWSRNEPIQLCSGCAHRVNGVCRLLTAMVKVEFEGHDSPDDRKVIVSVSTPDDFTCGKWIGKIYEPAP